MLVEYGTIRIRTRRKEEEEEEEGGGTPVASRGVGAAGIGGRRGADGKGEGVGLLGDEESPSEEGHQPPGQGGTGGSKEGSQPRQAGNGGSEDGSQNGQAGNGGSEDGSQPGQGVSGRGKDGNQPGLGVNGGGKDGNQSGLGANGGSQPGQAGNGGSKKKAADDRESALGHGVFCYIPWVNCKQLSHCI